MKITIATGPIFPVPAVRGGAVQRLWEGLAREFAKRGHEVTIFAREFPGQAKEETVDGIRYVRRGGYEQSTSIRRDLVQCLLYALKTARHVPSGDVVVTNDFWMPAVLPWLRPSVGKVIPCLQRFPKNQGRLYSKCAALAAVSRAVADAVKAQSPSVAGKVVVLPNAIDEVFLRETKRPGDKKTNRQPSLRDGLQSSQLIRDAGDGRAVRILYVGRIHPEKGLGLLVNALRLLAARDQKTKRPKDEELGWECVLVGPVKEGEGGGGERFADELRRQVKGLPVRFAAPVYEPSTLAKIYDEADLFVYPSIAETGESFGLAPLEAMARGVVPIVSDLSVFRDYLEPGANGLVFDHRAADADKRLAEAIVEILNNQESREQMGSRARRTAQRFSLREVANRYLSLFERCVRS
jgi:glycosyltransferase involved in cell wall biosynthesis